MTQYQNCSLWHLGNKKALARMLRFPSLQAMKELSRSDDNYLRFTIEANNKKRDIEDPIGKLKTKQKIIHRMLQQVPAPDYLMSPVKKRSYALNAKQHADNVQTLTLDIQKFFPSTSISKVYDFFKHTLHCEPDIANILTRLTTFKGRLPTGAPTSPSLAFHVNADMFHNIDQMCKKYKCTLTVYVDDLTISGCSIPHDLIWGIKQIIHNNGYKYHPKKQRFHSKNSSKLITGVIITPSGQLQIPNKQYQKIRHVRRELRLSLELYAVDRLKQKLKGLENQKRYVESFNSSTH